MKIPCAHLLAKGSDSIFMHTSERCGWPKHKQLGNGPASTRPFNLLLVTSHPDSDDPWAGEAVHVPVEFAEGAVLFDLTEVTRIDSWGLALFLEAMQRIAARGGRLFLIGTAGLTKPVADVDAALDTLAASGVLPDAKGYWRENARAGKTCKGQQVMQLCLRLGQGVK